MKLKLLKPLYLGGTVVSAGKSVETLEQHARELIQKQYAEEDLGDSEPVVTIADDPSIAGFGLTSDQLNQALAGDAPVADSEAAKPTKKSTSKKAK